MTIHRFFIKPENIKKDQVIFPEDISHQITQVLRLKENTKVIVLDNTLNEYDVVLEKVHKKQTLGNIIFTRLSINEPNIKVTLFQAIIAREKFEMILQKCTEIGITTFQPIITERTQVKDIKLDRAIKIITEASEQSERGKLPEIYEVMKFDQAIKNALENGPTYIAWEEESSNQDSAPYSLLSHNLFSLNERDLSTEPKLHINIFIGPEGGFTKQEIDFASLQGAKTFSLGKRILRAETAAIVTTALILINN